MCIRDSDDIALPDDRGGDGALQIAKLGDLLFNLRCIGCCLLCHLFKPFNC